MIEAAILPTALAMSCASGLPIPNAGWNTNTLLVSYAAKKIALDGTCPARLLLRPGREKG